MIIGKLYFVFYEKPATLEQTLAEEKWEKLAFFICSVLEDKTLPIVLLLNHIY